MTDKLKGDDSIATAPTQIRIDADIKKEAMALFSSLGLDMSGAVNLFLHQCVFRGGLPFAVEMPQYSQQTSDAMAGESMSDAADIIKDYVTEFSRLQDWMIPIKDAVPDTYDSMHKRYLELKVTLSSLGVNLTELER